MPPPGHAHPLQAKAIASVVAALFEAIWASSVLANPTGAQVVAGGVTVSSPSASQMNITQSTPNAIVNWNTFSIGAGEAVNIAQPSVTSALLNRVVGNDPSSIAGRLSANGRVFLVNPAGVIFAPGSSVNVGSLVASTLGISNADFLAGNFHFVGNASGAVVNAGSITAADGGTIALLGGSVTNSGMVAAKLGTVAMGAGSDVTLDFAGDGLTTLKINSGAANAFLGNTGTLAADGGTVVMSAQTADALAGTVINQQGIVRAQSLAERDGHIVLDGGTGGETLVSGTLDASGGAGLTGGQVDVTGYDVALLSGANVNASGAAGGGSVRFGGGAAGADPTIRDANAVWMDPNAQIHADALANGNGGHIVAYGTTAARIYGALTARGGAQGGNGGLIETSGGTLDVRGATIDASATNGKAGQWLLDPDDIDICHAGASTCVAGPGGSESGGVMMFGPTSSSVTDQQISTQLNSGTSVKVATSDGNINVDQNVNIDKSGGGNATLTLSAGGSVTLAYLTSITSSAGELGLVIDANVNGASPGNMVTLTSANIATNGGAVSIGTNSQSQVSIQSTTINTQGGNLTIDGTAPTSAYNETAVDIENSQFETGAGALGVTGTIGTSDAGTSGGGYGVYLDDSTLTSTSGNVTLDGTIYSGATDANGYGYYSHYSSVSTTNGNINVTGKALGTAAGPGNNGLFGVYLGIGLPGEFSDSSAQPTLASSSGNIVVNGTANGSNGLGVSLQFATVTNTRGEIDLTGTVDVAPPPTTGPGSGPTNSEPAPPAARSPSLTGGDGPWGVGLSDSTLNNSSGAITVKGTVPAQYDYGVGTEIDRSVVGTTSGAISLSGQSSGTPAANTTVQGIVLERQIEEGFGAPVGLVAEAQLPPAGGATAIQSDTGTISIHGSGSGTGAEGVLITDATNIQTTGGGAIDIRGAVQGGPQPTGSTSNMQNDVGTVINDATISSTIASQTSLTGTQGSISIAGSTNTSDPGLVLGNSVSGYMNEGPVTVSTGNGGTLVLRAANDGTTTSLAATGLTVQVPDGTLVLLPGAVDPSSNYAFVAENTTPITLFGTGAGLSIDQGTFSTLTQDVSTVVLGSSTHTGLITVNAMCAANADTCVLTTPTFASNLTLENDGSGSQGISLPSGAVVSGNTLTLISAGSVTQGAPIQATVLTLGGPGTFTLTNTGNAIGALAAYGTGSVNLFDSQGLSLGASGIDSFDAASGTFTNIGSIATMSLAGNFTAKTSSGDITVDTPIVSTASGATTLLLSAAGNINVTPGDNRVGNDTIGAAAGAGPLNVTLDANEGGAASAYGVTISGTTFNTGGGTFTIGDTGNSPVSMAGSTITTEGGGVHINATNSNGTALTMSQTLINSGAGDISITGTSLYSGSGVAMSGSALQTTNGLITLTGIGDASYTYDFGVVIAGSYSSAGTPVPTIDVTGSGSANITGTLGLQPNATGAGGGVVMSGADVEVGSRSLQITGTSTAPGYGADGVEIVESTLKSKGGAITLTGTANGTPSGVGVELSSTQVSAGAGNVLVTGTVNNPQGQSGTDGTGIGAYFSSIQTTTGSVTLKGTVTGATELAFGTLMDGGYPAQGSSTAQPTIQTDRGAINVSGSVPATTGISGYSAGSIAVDLLGANIVSTSGTITLTGLTTGTPTTGLSSTGVVLGAQPSDSSSSDSVTVSTPATAITTGSGTLSIYGSGSGSNAQGVLVADGSQIKSNNGGAIDIRGVVTSPTTSSSGGNIQYDYGTLIYNGTITATAPNTTISIAGSTNTSDAGLAFGAVPVSDNFYYTSGTVQVNAGTNGTLALRAANDGTATSFADNGASLASSGGTLVFMPASVNPTTFAFTAENGTPITLFGTGAAGLSIDAATYALFSGFSTLVLGSSTQTGLITVSGVCPSQGACTSFAKPTANQSLTLVNTGSGSQGIQLLYGISLGSNTLTLASAGNVTDPGGIQAAGLLLEGPGNFTLNDPQNDVGVLAMLNTGNVNFLNSTSFVIGPIVSHSFDAASNAATTIDATNSNLNGNLLAQAATGGIGLGGGTASASGPTGGKNTNLSASGTIDLVMENGVFTDNGIGRMSATNGWRIWASTWNGETRGNVQPNTSQPNFYGCTFGAGCSWGGVVPLTGDHFVYVARPTVIVTADGAVKIYGAPNPNFGYTISGLINGDPASTLSGTLSTNATTGSLPGQYAIDPAFLSNVGYIVQNEPGTLMVTLPYAFDLPSSVSAMQSFFGMSEKTFVYENNLQGTNICVGSNQPLFTTTPPGDNQDLLAVEWKRVRSQPNLNSCMLLNGQHGCGDF
ncbi:filamentous hemagglutinin N-terminal domain-containing protein [Paraburkholderia sp. J63]|uniref:two-partner secretion domain-containing protein n=1 Tax=Paraburkholderia sp. J63 TaxID=2805434 RepID=UPI002ABDF89F|nr:filamentous hemagglutinin N-terminal domain-containing protein [Paraburkholderia sp. J63]